jgi:hypothetical protein
MARASCMAAMLVRADMPYETSTISASSRPWPSVMMMSSRLSSNFAAQAPIICCWASTDMTGYPFSSWVKPVTCTL